MVEDAVVVADWEAIKLEAATVVLGAPVCWVLFRWSLKHLLHIPSGGEE